MKALVELDIPTDSREGLPVTSASDNLPGKGVGCSNRDSFGSLCGFFAEETSF